MTAMQLNMIKKIALNDKSAVFDLRLQVGEESITINLIAPTEREATIKAGAIREALKTATGCEFSWGDTLEEWEI